MHLIRIWIKLRLIVWNAISVRLKPKQERIKTVTFYLRDSSMSLVSVIFKTYKQYERIHLQKLIRLQICFVMAFLITVNTKN